MPLSLTRGNDMRGNQPSRSGLQSRGGYQAIGGLSSGLRRNQKY